MPISGAGESLRSATEGAVTAPYARDGTLSEERSLSDNKSSQGQSGDGAVPVPPAPDLLLTTPLHELHVELGAKMVPFAGYEMPVQYPLGILKEHLHTRAAAGLFDVSHMGQVRLTGDNPAAALETLVPGEIQALAGPHALQPVHQRTGRHPGRSDDHQHGRSPVPGRQCRLQGRRCRASATRLAGKAKVEHLGDRALLALQGPQAAEVMGRFVPAAETMKFMSALEANFRGARS